MTPQERFDQISYRWAFVPEFELNKQIAACEAMLSELPATDERHDTLRRMKEYAKELALHPRP